MAKKENESTAPALEEAFKKLDEIVACMENPDLPLEECFGKYQEGMQLIKACNESIEKIQAKLTVLEEGE